MKRKYEKKISRNGPRRKEQEDADLVKTEREADDVCTREDHLDIRIKEEPDAHEIDENHNGHSDLDAATSEVLHHHERVKVESDSEHVKEEEEEAEEEGRWVKEEEQDREEEEVNTGRYFTILLSSTVSPLVVSLLFFVRLILSLHSVNNHRTDRTGLLSVMDCIYRSNSGPIQVRLFNSIRANSARIDPSSFH